MKVVITGGGGFLGNRLARALSSRATLSGVSGSEEPIDTLVLFDRRLSPESRSGFPSHVHFQEGDVSERDAVFALADRDDLSVFHLASVVSGEGERDFDLAMRVNLEGTRHVFEACRARKSQPKIVFTSSVAAFGGPAMPPAVGDDTKRCPETTYGMTKVIGELFVNDYSRRGFVDARAARLPTVVVRPGQPNAAASSFASGLFREPLHGQPCSLPVDRHQAVPVLGYRAVIDSLLRLHQLPASALERDRVLTLPSLHITVQEMIDALEAFAARKGITLGPLLDEPDPTIQCIVAAWPVATLAQRALRLGILPAPPIDEILEDFIEDFGASIQRNS